MILAALLLCFAACGTAVESVPDAEEAADIDTAAYTLSDGVLCVDGEPVETDVTELYLEDFSAEDYSFLCAFSDLESLELNGCNISDLSVLADMTQMTALTLSRCTEITDLAPLYSLQALREFQLSEANVTDLSPLEGMDLVVLGLYDLPQLTDVSVVETMPHLEQLGIWGTSVTDLSALKGLTALVQLSYGESMVPDIAVDYSVLQDMTKLERLNLTRAGTTEDMSVLTGLTELQVLSLPPMDDFDLNWVAQMTKLEKLTVNVEDHPLADLTPLANLTTLTRFSVPWMTNDQIEWMAQTLPNCQVITDLYTG
jgi:internalin A